MDEKQLEGLGVWGLFLFLLICFLFLFLGKLSGFLFIYISRKFFNLNSEHSKLHWVLEMVFFGVGWLFGVGLLLYVLLWIQLIKEH
jgi:hypothetical protein